MYAPPSQWIWHPPPHEKGSFQPYKDFAANTWVEVMREEDPFGDEHYGAWYVSAKGSGVWLNIGKTITFTEHGNAYTHFGVRDNEAMCRKAATAGFDTVQFSAHHDHTNYPCDTAGGYPYMNIEVVAVKQTGTYACGSKGKPSKDVLRSGWGTDKCDCDNSYKFANCGRHMGAILRPPSPPVLYQSNGGNHQCSGPPKWFSGCKPSNTSTSCMRVSVSSAVSGLSIRNSTYSTGVGGSGFEWCIDPKRHVVR